MGDARGAPHYYQHNQPYPYPSSYPSQLSMTPNHEQHQQQYFPSLQSQMRSIGQGMPGILRQHSHGGGGTEMSPQGSGNTPQHNTGGRGGWGLSTQNSEYRPQASGSGSASPALQYPDSNPGTSRPQSIHRGSSPEYRSDSPHEEEAKPVLTQVGKRGRKKKVQEDELMSDLDDEEDDPGSRKKGRRPSLNANEKRKLQNRAAQRAFRERKEKRVTDLEDKVAAQSEQLDLFRDLLQRLHSENEALRRGEAVPTNTYQIPAHIHHRLSTSPQPTGSSANSEAGHRMSPPPRAASPRSLPPSSRRASFIPPEPNVISPPLPTYSYAHTTDTRPPTIAANIGATLTLARTPISMERGGATPEGTDGFRMYGSPATQQFNHQVQERQSQQPFHLSPYPTSSSRPNTDNTEGIDFDFDAPFDFSNSVPLPPLFQDLYDQAFPSPGGFPSNKSTPAHLHRAANNSQSPQYSSAIPSLVTSAAPSEAEEDCCPPDDEAEAKPLPGGRLPCNKPECDFSLVSCALPIPWRPQTLDTKEITWVCQQAWAKLCSHPLFEECDVDELCHELRDKTRCSLDGSLVILKSDVCSVFRSIPGKAHVRKEQLRQQQQ